MEKHRSASSYVTGAVTALFGALTLQDTAVIIGIVCTVATFGINWWYKHKEYRAKVSKSVCSDV